MHNWDSDYCSGGTWVIKPLSPQMLLMIFTGSLKKSCLLRSDLNECMMGQKADGPMRKKNIFYSRFVHELLFIITQHPLCAERFHLLLIKSLFWAEWFISLHLKRSLVWKRPCSVGVMRASGQVGINAAEHLEVFPLCWAASYFCWPEGSPH